MSLRTQIQKPLTPQQLDMVDVIDREFTRAKLPPEFAAAAVVNAWYESKLNPEIKSGYSNENSVGLFQLNIKGAGAGMVLADGTDQRKDPVLNTQRIIEEVKSSWGKRMREAYEAGDRNISTYSYLFAYDIERPADREGQGQKRAELTLEFFPEDTVKRAPLARIRSNSYPYLLTTSALVLGLALYIRFAQPKWAAFLNRGR